MVKVNNDSEPVASQRVRVEADREAIHHGRMKESPSKDNAVNWRVLLLTLVATVLVSTMKL